VATSTPDPLHLNWSVEAFTGVAAWPVIWIPALLAPIGVSLYVVSLRQALARSAARSAFPDLIEEQLPNTTLSGVQVP
jgi:hypothetical protein